MSNFDQALERFHLGDLEYGGGLANHGPMGAEALESLGHQALIPAFLDIYAPRLPPADSGRVLAAHEQAAARGDIDRRADWVATFEAELVEADWRAVLRARVPGLLPGLFAAAGHGLLRTAHAVRALEREDSPLRRRELARGLAHWEARYQTLPGEAEVEDGAGGEPGGASAAAGAREEPDGTIGAAAAGGGTGATGGIAAGGAGGGPGAERERASEEARLADFFAALPRLGEPAAREGLFFESIRRLDRFEPFVVAIPRAPRPLPAEDARGVARHLGGLARVAAALYLAHPEARIAYVHGVTIPVAVRRLLPFLSDPEAHRAARFALQAVAGLHALFGERIRAAPLAAEVVRTAESWDEIRYRAACSLQEHAIKLAEACLAEDRIAPDPVLRQAAADAALELEGRRGAGGC